MPEALHGTPDPPESSAQTAANPFTLPPTLVSDDDVSAALDLWAKLCWELSLSDVAVDLLDLATRDRAPADPEDTAVRRAAYLLEDDRFEAALEAIPSRFRIPPSDPADVALGHLVAATAMAGTGDDDAARWLTSVAAALTHTNLAVLHTLCLVRVGQARDDGGLVDAACQQLAHLGFRDRTTTPRAAALLLHARDRSAADAAHQTFLATVELLQSAGQSLTLDPQPVLDTANDLLARGDRSGAAILLRWATRLAPRGRRLAEAFRPISPARVGVRRGLLIGVAWLALAVVFGYALWTGIPELAIPALAPGFLWYRYVPIRGMSLADSRLYRRIRIIRAAPPAREEIRRYTIFGLGTVAFCVMWAFVALAAIGSALGVEWHGLPLWIHIVVWTVAMGVVPALVALVFWRLRRRRLAREASLSELVTQRELSAPGGRCRCWDTLVLGGAEAEDYLRYHLRPLPAPPLVAELSDAHPERELRTAYCHRTGAAWLRVGISPEGAAYLLRGPLVPERRTAGDDRADEPAPGFYL